MPRQRRCSWRERPRDSVQRGFGDWRAPTPKSRSSAFEPRSSRSSEPFLNSLSQGVVEQCAGLSGEPFAFCMEGG